MFTQYKGIMMNFNNIFVLKPYDILNYKLKNIHEYLFQGRVHELLWKFGRALNAQGCIVVSFLNFF